MAAPVRRICLAYSGGLDTSVILRWLREHYEAEIVAFCADLGQEEELDGLPEKARATGAADCVIDDLREEFARDFVFPMLRAGANDVYTISYYEAADLPFLGRAAPQWTVLDHYFAPFMGPTGPNRLISQTGQTDRLSNTGVITTLPSIWDRLSAAGISGANYGNQYVTASAFGPRLASVIRPIASFYSDAAAGTLPNVSYVDPDFSMAYTNTYHPHDDIRNGEAFLSSVYRAVTTGPLWRSSLLLITFDEWGGFYDHVRPPVAPIPPGELAIGNTDGLRGFRIPSILVSPFARRRNISSVVYDHASILRLIEWRWSLEPLTVRDAGANNLADELDFAHPDISAPVYDVPAGPFGGPCP